MEKTIFEKIIDGEIPSYKIYEDEHVYSFLDVFPITKGHTLVIPKKHSRNIFDCDPETAANIGRVLPKIANAVKEAYGCDGVNIFQNNEEYAGQSVFHLHFHIVPRYKDKDVNGNVINKVDNIDDEIEVLEKKHAKPRTTLDSIVSLFATKEDK